MNAQLKRWLPLALLLAIIVTVFATGLHRLVSLEQLGAHYEDLRAWAGRHPLWAPLLFGLIYAAAVAVSVPGATILTVTAGLLFGIVTGSIVVVIAATVGATLVFVIARTALGEPLRRRAKGQAFERMQAGFQADALSYLLVLRLLPLFPFWLVNLVPAFLGVPISTFVLATAIGIVPASVVYASVGNGLGAVLAAGGQPDLGIVFEPVVFGPLLGLAALALVPVVYKRWRQNGAA